MSGTRTMMIIWGAWVLASCGDKPPPIPGDAQPIADRWLAQNCSVGEDSLRSEVKRTGKSLGPAFLQALEKGLPDSMAIPFVQDLAVLYNDMHRQFEEGDSLLLLSEKDRELFRSQSLEAFIEAEYGKRQVEYRSRAALGLGLIHYSEGLPVLQKIANDGRYRPLWGSVREAIRMIEQRK